VKVLHVNYYDIKGGAAKAAYRLHCGLLDNGILSKMLVAEKCSTDDSVICAFDEKSLNHLRINQRIEALLTLPCKMRHDFPHSLNLFNSGLAEVINEYSVDLVHLHWINGGMIGISELSAIKYPLAWTLHDAWCYCGAEHHHMTADERYRYGYKRTGLNGVVWKEKQKKWNDVDFSVIAPSSWLFGDARQSLLLRDKNVALIPNGLNLNVFKSENKANAQEKIGFAQDKKIIAFGAFDVNDKNKGGLELHDAFASLRKRYGSDCELLLIGKGDLPLPFNRLSTGALSRDEDLASAYSAADVFVLASKYDNLPNMLIEAMACGTPCVAFRIGGIPDIIDHKVNGYLAEPFDCEDFAEGISWVLENNKDQSLSRNARKKIEDKFDINKVVKQYIGLYENILKRKES
jgi:glycosyltransferase involved in cell wall biosynthesis